MSEKNNRPDDMPGENFGVSEMELLRGHREHVRQFMKEKGIDVDTVEGLVQARRWLLTAPDIEMYWNTDGELDPLEVMMARMRRGMLLETVESTMMDTFDAVIGPVDDEDAIEVAIDLTNEKSGEIINVIIRSTTLKGVVIQDSKNPDTGEATLECISFVDIDTDPGEVTVVPRILETDHVETVHKTDKIDIVTISRGEDVLHLSIQSPFTLKPEVLHKA